MSEANTPTHPRKLYTTLRACSSAKLRADTSLDFLCKSAGSAAGLLFLLRDGQPELASKTTDAEPAAGLLAEITRVAARELDTQPDARSTKTVDASALEAMSAQPNTGWTAPNGKRFELRMLSTYRTGRWVPLGLVALEANAERSLEAFRQAHVDAICNAFIDTNAEAQTR